MSAVATAAAALLIGLAGFGIVAGRRRRRRCLALREALHEIRRPLQALMLDRPPGSREGALLAQLRVAIIELEAAAEGRPAPAPPSERTSAAALLHEAEERWSGAAVSIERPVPDAALRCDRVRLGMALDNLIANGLEHGAGGVSVAARDGGGSVRLEVVNGGRSDQRPGPSRPAPPGSPRGNGLRIAARHAGAEGGRLHRPRAHGDAIVAAVELPRPDPGPQAA